MAYIALSSCARHLVETNSGFTESRGAFIGIQNHRLTSSRSRSVLRLNVKSSATKQQPDLQFNKEEEAKWQSSKVPLIGLGLSEEETDHIMAKSFGWKSSPYWGEEKAKTVPQPENVQKTLDFFLSLGLSDADVAAFLKKFPEGLGCDVEEEMQKNVKILESEWGISGSTLRNLLLRNPKVLGYNVDCKGDCMAQCTRCWVRF